MIFDWSTHIVSTQGLYAGAGAYRGSNWVITYVDAGIPIDVCGSMNLCMHMKMGWVLFIIIL